MIGADTNVLVRAVLDDDPKEAAIARKFLSKTSHSKNLYISSYAILEMVWVLKVKKRSRKQIYNAVLTLLDSPGISIGQKTIVMNALEKYDKGKADFGDYLILAEGEANNAPRLASFEQQFCEDETHCRSPEEF